MPDFLAEKSIKDFSEFDDHRFVAYLQDEASGLEGFIVIHRSNPSIPSFGATRLWQYGSLNEALQDALRLSRLMSYKSAMAGLDCGGAKGVIIDKVGNRDEKKRKELFRSYAEKVAFLSTHFVTGTDAGVFRRDLNSMKAAKNQIVGFNDNATFLTAVGIFESIKVCLKEIYGNTSFEGRSFAIQGLGKVGNALLTLIEKEMKKSGIEAGKIYGADIDPKAIALCRRKFPKVIIVKPEEIHKQNVDVFSPCALSGSLSSMTITEIRAKIIAGSANNQLANENIGVLLHKLDILYAPDYVINAGGLIAVFDEFKNKTYRENKVLKQVLEIPNTLQNILRKSKKENTAPNIIANIMAEKIFNSYA